MTVGQRIARLRVNAELSQEQLAERLYVTRAMVSKWERDICPVDYNTILRIAEILSVSPDDIASRVEMVINELHSFLSDIDSKDLLSDLNTFLSTIKSRDRSVFIRRYYFLEDNSIIAEHYGLKESNIRTILMRTRKKLKKYLEMISK